MSDINPVNNDVRPTDYQPPVQQPVSEDAPDPEEIANTETDTAQNVDTFA